MIKERSNHIIFFILLGMGITLIICNYSQISVTQSDGLGRGDINLVFKDVFIWNLNSGEVWEGMIEENKVKKNFFVICDFLKKEVYVYQKLILKTFKSMSHGPNLCFNFSEKIAYGQLLKINL